MAISQHKSPLAPVGADPLSDLVRDLSGPGIADAAPAGSLAEVELALADLISDANGEIVLYNDSGFRTLAIATDAATVANGQAARHVTAGGEDVSGFNYVTFDNGLTLYFPDGLDLIVTDS